MVTMYQYKSFQCELCKTSYTETFKTNGRKYPLLDLNLPEGDYMILESLTLDKHA